MEGQVCRLAPASLVSLDISANLKEASVLLSGFANKVCGKTPRATEPLIYWKWLVGSLGRHKNCTMF